MNTEIITAKEAAQQSTNRKRWRPGCVWLSGRTWYFRAGSEGDAQRLGDKRDLVNNRDAWIKALPLLFEANGVSVPTVPEPPPYVYGSAKIELVDGDWMLFFTVSRIAHNVRICTQKRFPNYEDVQKRAEPLIRRIERGDWQSLMQCPTSNMFDRAIYDIDEYSEKLASQDGKCAICGDEPKKMDWDHDHATGLFRDLLCGHCNRALGSFRDDPVRCDAAAAYLRKHGK